MMFAQNRTIDVRGKITDERSKLNSSKEGNQGNESGPVLKLITDINPDVISIPDNDFLESSVEEIQSILEDKIEKVYADGAYNRCRHPDLCPR